MKKIISAFKALKQYIDGDFAYQNYLEHCAKNHSQEIALDKKSFLKIQQQNKWSKINRCC